MYHSGTLGVNRGLKGPTSKILTIFGGIKREFFFQKRGKFRGAREIFLAGSKAGLSSHGQTCTEDTKIWLWGVFTFVLMEVGVIS